MRAKNEKKIPELSQGPYITVTINIVSVYHGQAVGFKNLSEEYAY